MCVCGASLLNEIRNQFSCLQLSPATFSGQKNISQVERVSVPCPLVGPGVAPTPGPPLRELPPECTSRPSLGCVRLPRGRPSPGPRGRPSPGLWPRTGTAVPSGPSRCGCETRWATLSRGEKVLCFCAQACRACPYVLVTHFAASSVAPTRMSSFFEEPDPWEWGKMPLPARPGNVARPCLF